MPVFEKGTASQAAEKVEMRGHVPPAEAGSGREKTAWTLA